MGSFWYAYGMNEDVPKQKDRESLVADIADDHRVPTKKALNYKIIYFLIPLLALVGWGLWTEYRRYDLYGEKGVEVNRPDIANRSVLRPDTTFIEITEKSEYISEGKIVSESVLRNVFVSRKDNPVVIVVNEASPSDSIIYLMDLARESGVNDISLEADK
jgi:hypothetical protein